MGPIETGDCPSGAQDAQVVVKEYPTDVIPYESRSASADGKVTPIYDDGDPRIPGVPSPTAKRAVVPWEDSGDRDGTSDTCSSCADDLEYDEHACTPGTPGIPPSLVPKVSSIANNSEFKMKNSTVNVGTTVNVNLMVNGESGERKENLASSVSSRVLSAIENAIVRDSSALPAETGCRKLSEGTKAVLVNIANEDREKAIQKERATGTGTKTRVREWINSRLRLILLIAVVVCAALLALLAAYLSLAPRAQAQGEAGGGGGGGSGNGTKPSDPPGPGDIYVDEVTGLQLVPRQRWRARTPTGDLTVLKRPAPYVIIAHTVSDPCGNIDSCCVAVSNIQARHMVKWSDIGYNFLVGGDGRAYVGRGWDYVGAHTKPYNFRSIGIAFIGDFVAVAPPLEQRKAAQDLIYLLLRKGMISEDYLLFGQGTLQANESPGKMLIDIIAKWPHYSSERPKD